MLTSCPACRGSLSTHAGACPHCGHPMRAPTAMNGWRTLFIVWASLFTILAGLEGMLWWGYLAIHAASRSATPADNSGWAMIAILLLVGWFPYLSWRSRR